MEKNSRYFIVGLFVSLSLVGLIFFVVWLAGTHDSRNYKHYTVHFDDPVSGLKESAIVQFRGVEVGRVTDIRLVEGSTDLVKVDIEISDTIPIYRDSYASLATLGITGLTYIELTTSGTDTSPPVQPPGEIHPVIRGQGTQLSKLFQDIPAISKQLLELSEKLNTAFDEDNMKSLDATIRNIEEMSGSVNSLLSQDNINNTTVTLQNVAKASESMDQLVERFNHTADEIDKAVSSLNSVVTDNRSDIDKFAGSGLNQITEMSRETTEMARAIRRLADRLEQDPSRVIYQPRYRGVEVEK